jgi:hypothetical protein
MLVLFPVDEESPEHQIQADQHEGNSPQAEKRRCSLGHEHALPKDDKAAPQEAEGNQERLAGAKLQTALRLARPEETFLRSELVFDDGGGVWCRLKSRFHRLTLSHNLEAPANSR